MSRFTVIAHRGASGYLPENTKEAAALAHRMGADLIEMDVVLTHDGVPIVLHDLYLDDVVEIPHHLQSRQRPDGRHYVSDYGWEEISHLLIHARLCADGQPACPARDDGPGSECRIASLDAMCKLISNLNTDTGRAVGIYVEPKSPAFHAQAGLDVFAAVLEQLEQHGLARESQPAYLQSFDTAALAQAKASLPRGIKLVQLIADRRTDRHSLDFDSVASAKAIKELSETVDGLGPPLSRLLEDWQPGSRAQPLLVRIAHQFGMFVHVWHGLEDRLPDPFPDMDTAVRLLQQGGLDGVFTDHPDQIARALNRGNVTNRQNVAS